ncbi:trypsin-like peptidase domain-containing protein [Streptomyces ficellus]|uniref:Trypsin-like peptidase domain-containing protein n=1 Tax=Streptomyces ficellus TaxID=1977088 RepID=A0ABT7Z4Z5_9ACTN|nr:trypsin-like serine protease [Streptomyces ficellus]MDN3294547.1 trypsin-like peptidase domain-containing protein [Streptomyces ficellus]
MHGKRPSPRPLLWIAALTVVATAGACAGPSHSAPRARAATSGPPAPQRSAAPGAGLPSVGVLLDAHGHWCTASVVDSPKGNVVATAAHCVYGDGAATENFSFAPAYSGKARNPAPYGEWKVRSVAVDDAWREHADDAHDYAFLTLEADGRGRQVQQVVGAAKPEWTSGPVRRVTVVGYPNKEHNPADGPVSCTTGTAKDPHLAGSMVMECDGFFDGTSGSPWLADGRLIGVLSGGDTDTESTAVLFDARTRALYDRAVKASGA